MTIVIPSLGVLNEDWKVISQKIELLKPFVDTIHIDLCDGKFAPTATFSDPLPFKQFSKDIFFELHLMVENPTEYIKPWADAGIKRFIGHIESMEDPTEFVAQGQLAGEVGLAIDADSSIDTLKVHFDDLDCLLVMTVKAGQSGQEFITSSLQRIEQLREKTLIPIEVDGGINAETIVKAAKAGANRFVTTKALFESEDKKKIYDELVSLAVQSIYLPPVTSL